MKKFLLTIVTILLSLIMIPVVNAKNDVSVYMFTKNGCPACEQAREYFEGLLEEDENSFKLVNIEVWCGTDYVTNPDNPQWILGSQDAFDLLQATLEKLEQSTSELATPTIVIGDYITVGLPNDTTEVEDAIKKAKNSKKEIDVVKDLAKEKDIDIDSVTKDFDVASCDLKEDATTAGKYDVLIIIGIFAVLIGGFVALIFVGKKNN